MAKKVQLMSNPKQWQTIDGEQVLVDVEQHDLDPITDSSCVKIEGHRTLEESVSLNNTFTPEITETKIMSRVGGDYHDNVVDGAYEEAILYGNTQVNVVESVTVDLKYIPHSFTSFQGNESKIGNYHSGRTNQVAPLVKGVTMVNLCQETSATFDTSNSYVVENVKGNTTYTVFFNFTVKNTNAGIIIQSYNGNTYLENSIYKTQLGDKVKFTFTTHSDANRFSICNPVAYGGETIQLDDIMVIEGDVTDLNLPFFKGMRSVELSRPLTNLFADDNLQIYDSNVTSTVSNGNITVTSTAINVWTSSSIYLKDLLKPNTKYLVMWDSLVATQTVAGETIISSYAFTSNTNLKTSDSDIIRPTLRSYVFDTGNFDVNDIVIRIHATTSNSETGTTTVTGLRVFEWDDSLRALDLQSLGYFSGTKYVSAPRTLETEGKNLYPYGDINFTPTDDKVDNWYDAKGTMYMYGDVAQKSKSRFLLKKGTYTIRFGTWSNIDSFQLIDDKEALHGKIQNMATPTTFTLKQDTYCTLRLKATSKNVATTVTGIQIERGETATTYEAYQSRYYKPRETEEIILRSLPNGVCDTFNLQTGELVQRVGEIVLDGSEAWVQNTAWNTTVGVYDSSMFNLPFDGAVPINSQNEINLACDRLNVDYEQWNTASMSISIFKVPTKVSIVLPNSIAQNISEFKQYLQQNPITAQYELAEPIITKLQTSNRVYDGQTKAQVLMGNKLSALTYYSNNYYLKVGNLSPIPAIVEPITHIPYNVRLKENTNYTLKYNRGNSSSMTFDLGGTSVTQSTTVGGSSVQEELLIKTPKYALTHNQLILTGNGYTHNFVIVEGDMRGKELPFFEGMKDVKMPIVKNVGKNLLDESSMRVFYESGITMRTYDAFPCKPNTRYCFVSVGGEAACNWFVCKKDARYERQEGKSVGIIKFLGYAREMVAPQDCYYMCIYTGSNPTTDREVYDIQTAIYEGSFAECVNYGCEDYKENSVYAIQGEIPFSEDMFEQGNVGDYSKNVGQNFVNTGNATRICLKSLLRVKIGTTYTIRTNSDYQVQTYSYTIDDKVPTIPYATDWSQESVFVAQDSKLLIAIRKKDNSAITPSVFNKCGLKMYELDSTISLRSLPNGVKDELNLLTGEYIQRVGEVIIDGSGDYTEHIHASSTHYGFRVPITLKAKVRQYSYESYPSPIICDKLPSIKYGSYFDGVAEGVSMYEGESATVSNIYISFNRNRINMSQEENSIDHVKEYCKTNPLTVQYELAEPIISYPRLVSNNQEREVGVKLPLGQVNTHNPSTGITTVRVGKIVLDGSENWVLDTKKTNTQVFELKISDMAKTEGNIYCETMRVGKGIDTELIYITSGCLYIALLKTKASTVDELKTYLASNPVTAWYELKYPQIQPDIVLPNGVHDEYNPETGVYTKKVGFIEFDGGEDWTSNEPNGELQQAASGAIDMYGAWTTQPLPNIRPANVMTEGRIPGVCDSFSFKNATLDETNEEFYFISHTGRFNMNIAKTRLTGSNVSHLKAYLSRNPIKLWYELETPITYQLTPYFGLPQPYAYEDGYLIHESAYAKTTLPPEFKYKLVANRTGQVMQNNRKLQQHTSRLSNLEAIIIEATIESMFDREMQNFELELMNVQLVDLGE